MLVQNFPDAFEKVAIHHRLAFFQEEIGSLPNESVLVVDQTILKSSEITLAYPFHKWFEFIQSIFVQHFIIQWQKIFVSQ